MVAAPQPPSDSNDRLVVVRGSLGSADAPELCDRLRHVVAAGGHERVGCDVAAVCNPDVETVDALARLMLDARRLGVDLRLVNASPDLAELLGLVGLAEAVGLAASGVESLGQAEQREEPGGVEEECDPADPAV